MSKNRKYLHIIEYLKNCKIPERKEKEFDLDIDSHSIIRSSVIAADYDKCKEQVKEDYTDYLYKESELDNYVLPLDDVIIYDNIDVDETQEIAYVFECPICLSKTITSDSELDFCPQCENSDFPFNLLALINTKQMEDLAINNDDITNVILTKDNNFLEILEKK